MAQPALTHVQPPSPAERLMLDAVSGPALPPIAGSCDAALVLGRSSQSSVVMLDEGVSRRHASIECRSGTWYITDLGSRHGTHVNAVRLDADKPAPLRNGDMIGIGPWTLRVRIVAGATPAGGSPKGAGMPSLVGSGSAGASHRMVSMMDMPAPAASHGRERVERVQERELAQITSNRLQLLIGVAAAVTATSHETDLAEIIVKAAAEGTGFPRAFVVRDANAQAGDLAIVGEYPPPAPSPTGSTPALPAFSRSLITAARGGPDKPEGELVRLTTDAPMTAASIMSLGIQTALCAPIVVGATVGGFLYLDSREGESRSRAGASPALGRAGPGVPNDAAAYCSALAKLYTMALSNIGRAELEERQREMVRELEAAREVQKMIMPPEHATVGGIGYAMRSKSGRYVAGDLFDVVALPDGKVAVLLGDVAGKGVPAAILMATAQTHLNVSLRSGASLSDVVMAVNRHVCHHAMSSKFISLWIGVIDPVARTVEYVDAGHGYWLIAGGEAVVAQSSTGIPLGIDPDFEYGASTLVLERGRRLIVFSDGVVEQPPPPGQIPPDALPEHAGMEMFGMRRAVKAIDSSKDVSTDVTVLFEAVLSYAKTDDLADDTTVASLEIA